MGDGIKVGVPMFDVGITVGKLLKAEVAVGAEVAVEKTPIGVDACSVANKSGVGEEAGGFIKLQDSIMSPTSKK